jgi:hypothetical protein
MLAASAIQNVTKFHHAQRLRLGSTSHVSINDYSRKTRSPTWLQVVVGQHELGIGEAGLALHGQLVDDATD